MLRYIFFHHQTTTIPWCSCRYEWLRYIFFHHQTTTLKVRLYLLVGCVISSFITKPQPQRQLTACHLGCVISSFITKPQRKVPILKNPSELRYIFFHHQTTTWCCFLWWSCPLRYIFFHHQTTTGSAPPLKLNGCVISSFITKPQQYSTDEFGFYSCVISSFITKPQPPASWFVNEVVALYLLSSPNHNTFILVFIPQRLRYIFFHHQTTTFDACFCVLQRLRYIFFHHQTTTFAFWYSCSCLLRYIFFHHQTTTDPSLSFSSTALRYIFFHHQTTTHISNPILSL